MTPLEAMKHALATGQLPPNLPMNLRPSVAQTIGFEAVSVDKGSATFRMETKVERHANPMGTIHGGILCDIADAAIGMACATLLGEGESFTTVDLKMNFFRPVWNAQIEARAKVVQPGRTIVYLECDVVSIPEGKLVAKATSTCAVLRGDAAKGR